MRVGLMIWVWVHCCGSAEAAAAHSARQGLPLAGAHITADIKDWSHCAEVSFRGILSGIFMFVVYPSS